MRQGRVCAAGGKELRVRGASMILPTHWAPERRGPRWSPSSLHLSVHSSGPCLLRTAHQRWKVSCLGPGAGAGLEGRVHSSPSPHLLGLCRGWEGWVQADTELGRVCKLADALADRVGRA